MLRNHFSDNLTEAGCDEAGRGCLAGPVFAAAVILPRDYRNEELTDSKQLSVRQRERLRREIMESAIAWGVDKVDAPVIDEINILRASIMAMHLALDQLTVRPELILVDGNRFYPYPGIAHRCIVGGDAKFLSIAAASVMAKTSRDHFMEILHDEYPAYDWLHNRGYPCPKHRAAIGLTGLTQYHRRSFRTCKQLRLDLNSHSI